MPARHSKHEPTKRRKGGRHRGKAGGRWRIASLSGVPVGPDVTVPSLEEVLAAMAALPDTLDWESLGGDVLPVFPRVRPQPPGSPDPVQLVVPPGIAVRFGVDAGPMFLTVHQGILEGWGLGPADLLAVALGNLKRRVAEVSPRDVIPQRVDGIVVRALQSGTSSGSALVLLPEELARIFGPEPQLFVAPMRDLLLSFPLAADRGLAVDLYEAFASQDPNHLPPRAFPFVDGVVGLEPLERDAAVRGGRPLPRRAS